MALLVMAIVGPVGVAVAEQPEVRIERPRNGSVINNATPRFSGTTFNSDEVLELGSDPVTLSIYAGTAVAEGARVQALTASAPEKGAWAVSAQNLSDGTYTAQATQTNMVHETGASAPVTFTVDTTPPQVSLTSPTDGSSTSGESQLVSGYAGIADGDSSAVTIQLFADATGGAQGPKEALVVPVSNGRWSASFGGLSPGTYVVLAEQRDRAGNTGSSPSVSFTVTAPSPAPFPPPVASFKWFPAVPKTGESVSLVSSSVDNFSPITEFAWALTSSSPFHAGKPVMSTSFSTPGGHVLRLRVADAHGLSSVAAETIVVTSAPLAIMQPFPIVRIAGSETSSGVNLSLLSVQVPVAARVTVSCRGRGCKTKSQSLVALASAKKRGAGAVLLSFRRFQRPLRAGVILEIRVSKPGQVGKYTRFAIRRGKLPTRQDECLGPIDPKPIPCPAS